MANGSVLAGIRPPEPVDLVGSFLGGQQARQNLQLGQQQLAQSEQLMAQRAQAAQQQITRVQYEEAVQRMRIINRLARQVREIPSEQERQAFVQRLDPEMLQSVGVDPAQVAGVGLSDQSLDALIGQTQAVLPDADSSLTAEQRDRRSLMRDLEGGIDPKTGQLKPEGQLTARQRAAANALGLTAKAGTATARERIAADRDVTTRVAESEAEIAGTTAEAKEAARLAAQLDKLPAVKAAVVQAQERVRNEVDAESDQRKNIITLNMYETAMRGLSESLGATTTGPVFGLIPAVTAEQQIAEGAISAMAPILKSLFRTAGEGTFTDKDQELLLRMIPTRADQPAARASKIENIDAIVRVKLGSAPGGGSSPPAEAQVAPVAQEQEPDVITLPNGIVVRRVQ